MVSKNPGDFIVIYFCIKDISNLITYLLLFYSIITTQKQEQYKHIIPESRWELFAVIMYGMSVGIKTVSLFGSAISKPISKVTVIMSCTTSVTYILRFNTKRYCRLNGCNLKYPLVSWRVKLYIAVCSFVFTRIMIIISLMS
jgi:hypothetical protein